MPWIAGNDGLLPARIITTPSACCFAPVTPGIFGASALGGLGGVSLASQFIGTLLGVAIALTGGFVVYGLVKFSLGIRLTEEEEFQGADLSIHQITSEPRYDQLGVTR